MRQYMLLVATICLLFAGYLIGTTSNSAAGVKDEAQVAHMVYFTLKDNSPATAANGRRFEHARVGRACSLNC